MTAYRHARKKRAPVKRTILEDPRLRKRCETSSDDEAEFTQNATATARDTDTTSSTSDEDVQATDSESEQIDLTSHFWDEAVIEDMVQDMEEAETTPITSSQNNDSATARRFIIWILYSICFLQCCHVLSNKCVEHLLILLQQVFVYLAEYSALCSAIASIFPVTLFLMRKFLGFDRDDFTKYIVCPNCYALYRYHEVVYTAASGRTVAKLCENMVYFCKSVSNPNSRRKGKVKCGSPLVKEIKVNTLKSMFYPIKVYCYNGVLNQVEKFLQRSNFDDLCQKWKKRSKIPGQFADVYDGHIWEKFQTVDGRNFLNQSYHYGMMLNVDWFQPFKRRRDCSVGVIYMVVLNLPREIRFKPENVILVGIIPALRKEPETLNTFLKPMVEELQCGWRGVMMTPIGLNQPVIVKLVLLCAAADIPAARKLCGFLGHSATQGCSHCCKKFVDSENKRSCGGFNVGSWVSRNRLDHIKFAKLAISAETFTERCKIEKLYGYRHTALLDLEYFEPSSFLTIDPMHNLFLGTAKRITSHWIDSEILGKHELLMLSEKIEEFNVCSDVGRLPSNISTNYGQFTAQEWKNWVLIYSLYVLNQIVGAEHLKVWQTFVLACKYLCKPCISNRDLEIGHNMILKFCKEVEQLYGASFITPNMHLHCHLRESILNYGSVYGFWLFSFERYNGLMGDFPTNNRSVEIQLMRKFQQINFLGNLKYENLGEFQNKFTHLIGIENNSVLEEPIQINLFTVPTDALDTISEKVWSDMSLMNYKYSGFSVWLIPPEQRVFLHEMYTILYGTLFLQDGISDTCKRVASIYIRNQLFGSTGSRSKGASIVYAKWAGSATDIVDSAEIRPAKVKYYICHTIEMSDGSFRDHLLAVVEWFKCCDQSFGCLPPVSVWDTKYQSDGPATFLPVQRIIGRCAYAYKSVGIRKYLITCPIPNNAYL